MAAAQRILDHGDWCVYEACVDLPEQVWETRVRLFRLSAEAVVDALEAEIEIEPEHDARLTGCDRRNLRPEPEMGAYLCYLTDDPVPSRSW